MWVEIKSKVSQRFKRRRSKNRSPRCQQAVESLICLGGQRRGETSRTNSKQRARNTERDFRLSVSGGVTCESHNEAVSRQVTGGKQQCSGRLDVPEDSQPLRHLPNNILRKTLVQAKIRRFFFCNLPWCLTWRVQEWEHRNLKFSSGCGGFFFSFFFFFSFIFLNVWLLTRPLALSKSYPGIRLFDRSIINAVFIFIPSAFLCLFTPMCPHLPGFLFSLSGVDVTRKEEIEWVLIFTVVYDANSENSCIFCTIWHVYRSATCCLNSC